MKSIKHSEKKTRSIKRKSKSSSRSEVPLESQIPLTESITNLKAIQGNKQNNGVWELEQEEKNVRELQAVKDLCALSEEDHSLSVESNFQKIWMDSSKVMNKELSWVEKENNGCNPNITVSGNDKPGKSMDKRKSESKIVSKLETLNILQTRNFLRENMLFKPKKDWAKERKLLGKAELDKLLSDRNAEISNSLRDLKNKGQEKNGREDTGNEALSHRKIEKYVLKKYCNNNKEYSRDEWQDSLKIFHYERSEENNGVFIPKGIDPKTINLINSVKPNLANKATEKSQTQDSKVLRHEIIELIERFERSNRMLKHRDPSNVRLKKKLKKYAEESNVDAENAINNQYTSKGASIRPPTVSEVCNPPIRRNSKNREFLASEETQPRNSASQPTQEHNNNALVGRFSLQSDDSRRKIRSKTVYKATDENTANEKPPLSSRNTARDQSAKKVRIASAVKAVPCSMRVERYSLVTRDCTSLPQSLADEQIDDVNHNKGLVSSMQNIIEKERPMTASLESPQRKNIIKILNYFRNCGEARRSYDANDSVLKKMLQNSSQRRDRSERRSVSRVSDSDFGVKLADSFRASSRENTGFGNNFKRSLIQRNSMNSVKVGPLSATWNFREVAISTLQKGPSATFLQAVGKRFSCMGCGNKGSS